MTGAQTLTIRGSNFGASGATVIVGATPCGNTQHSQASPHTQLTCTLPSGRGSNVPIVVIQRGGSASVNALVNVTYAVCAPGSYRLLNPSSTSNCTLCPRGTYAAQPNSEFCTACPFGQVATTLGSTGCKPCSGATYATQDHTACATCPAGTAQSGGVCNDCPVGTFAGLGAISCQSCAAGSFGRVTGLSTCSHCLAGSVRVVSVF